ncbi:polymeric immunoglobulin receptor [Python bivittatus]|uniref:polymeric immunoglobulin receptor n=1 Tax=Python bivittatus TaxID=176946 RepID=UPI000441CE78|nr:polymeric immunoglobulin receptor [Python bivittatus]XP_015744134.1 polymeric immunoglobulin receptor [Python bivittatus]
MALLFFVLALTFIQAESESVSDSNVLFGPKQVTGLLGGSVSIKCFYPPSTVNIHSRKYWCKESTRHCYTFISSNGFVAKDYNDRASITDFSENGIFTIEISDLRSKDVGLYRCGIGLNDYGLSFKVKLEVTEDPVLPEEAQLYYAEQQKTVTMTCDFGIQYASERKYLCKMTKTNCYNVIDTYGNVEPSYLGRVLLTNLDTPGSFSVIMSQLKKEDAGLYLCGAGNYGTDGESKELDLHVYEDRLAPKQQTVLKGVQGGSVTVECHYDPKENDTLKYWCKWRQHGCTEIINSNGYVLDSYEGRVVMHDDSENGTFTIILNQLQKNDIGYYWCMTDGKEERKSSAEVTIVEGKPALQAEKEIQAVAGSPLTISCSYPCKYFTYEKYWCKWKNTGCKPLISSEQNQSGLVVNCDKDSRILSLTFDQVAPTDQGWYWCGVRQGQQYGETVAVHLQVEGVPQNGNDFSIFNEDHDIAIPGINPNRNSPLSKVNQAAEGESSTGSHAENKNSVVLLATLIPLGIVFLLLITVFTIKKFRLFKNSDLVSVGSYRTNISMTDFENARQYGAKDNACLEEIHETQIGKKDEYASKPGSPKEAGKLKKPKRGSKEEVEMAYTTFLLNSDNISSKITSPEQ